MPRYRVTAGLAVAVASCLAVGVVVLCLPAAAWAARTVKVESKGGQRAHYRTSTRGGVRLKRQLSRDACVEGQSWGFDRDGIWVDKGCRAEFEVGAPDGGYDPPSGRTVRVESRGGGYYHHRTSTRGGVRLYKQLSRDACVEGQSWGFDRDGIWVDKGCRAEFEVGSGGGLFGGGDPPRGRTVKVESRNGQYYHHRTSTRGGVRLYKQLSRDACVEGRTWGFDRDGIWVDKG
ncbi:MAG TPA: DUF3011 domain-containing protein, partial [Vicinamibacteria bacterium]|nr:DUF3011 domain-containing protein [Vicinamibacteria bacterium]